MIKQLTKRFILLCAISLMGMLQLAVTQRVYAQTSGEACGPTGVELEIFSAYCGRDNGYFRVTGVTGGTAPYKYARNGVPFQSFNTFGSLLPGEYTISVRDANGCIYTEALVIPDFLGPSDFTATVTQPTCGSSSGQVTVTEIANGARPYRYSKDGGATLQNSNVLTGLAAGTHQIMVMDRLGCSVVKEVTVTSVPGPSSVAVTLQAASCTNNKGSISIGAVTGGLAPYTYSLDGENFTASTTMADVAPGNYTLTVKDANSCTLAEAVTIEEAPLIQVTVTPQAKAIGQNKTGSASVSAVSGGTAPYTYQLDGGSFTASQTFSNLGAGTHTLVVKDSFGCTTEVSFSIESVEGIDIPDGFTPNGDGINDLLAIKNLSVLFPDCKVTVYNRWGSLVFESRGYRDSWDGTRNGKMLPDGTYYCVIEFGDAMPAIKKSLTIMR